MPLALSLEPLLFWLLTPISCLLVFLRLERFEQLTTDYKPLTKFLQFDIIARRFYNLLPISQSAFTEKKEINPWGISYDYRCWHLS